MNENLSGVQVQKESLPSSPFSYRKKLNTSYGFGECQPILARTIEESQCTSQFAINTLIRLSPLIAPSFCEIKHKQFFAFVPLTDLIENVDNILSHVPKALVDPNDPTNYITGYINEFPTIDQSIMLWYLLRDSQYCIFLKNNDTGRFGMLRTPFSSSTLVTRVFSNLHPWYRQDSLLNLAQNTQPENCWSPDYGDYNYRYTVGEEEYIASFRLSDAGKRLRKIFIGLGFRPSFGIGVKPNMLIVPAWFKMYFDIFNLPQYDNWLDSDCYKMLHYFDRYGTSDLSLLRVPVSNWDEQSVAFARLFYNFVVNELSYCFYTEDKDFISAHISTSSLPARDLNEFNNLKLVDSQGTQLPETDHFYNDPFGLRFNSLKNLTELDDKLLKKMYRQINQESTIGYDIASILRTLGYDDYVDTCKSNFIGSVEQDVQINPVISQSGTSEKKLGDYAGYGVSYQNGHEFTYKNDEYGFLLGIGVMIPDSDYNSALDPSLLGVDRFTFGKDFDGYGFEPTPRACVGSQTIMDTPERANLDATTFGYVPVGTHRKVSGGNILNGDMSLLSMRNTFLPYQLDRMIYDNPESFSPVSGSTDSFVQNNLIVNGEFPQASKIWRYVTRYPFLGQFNRIFYNSPTRYKQIGPTIDYRFGNMPDNFYAHNEVKCTVWKKQLPIDSTWQTIDDPSEHKPTLKIKS